MTVDSKRAKSVQVGDRAPDFALPNQSGEPVRLSDFLGKTDIVLYFYPEDDWTPGKIGV
jgi:thioredoxin-dependent peroxiredoxin